MKSPKNVLLLVLLFSVGCSAQSAQSPEKRELDRRITQQVRANFNVPPTVNVTISERKPSEFPEYDQVAVTLSGNGRSNSYDFLVSKDGKSLIRMLKMDLSKDPAAEAMSKMDLKGRPVAGDPNAKVTMVIYDDFQCPYCARFYSSLFGEEMKPYRERMKIVFKDYPLYEIHPWASRAAVNALCLADQNEKAYWEYLEFAHAQQRQINEEQKKGMAAAKDAKQPAARTGPADELLDRTALQMGSKHSLNPEKLQACVKAQDDERVRASVKEAEDLGVNSTPTVFINGEKLEGAVPEPELKVVLNRILAENGVEPPKTAAGAQPGRPSQ